MMITVQSQFGDSEFADNCDAQAPIQQAMLASVGRDVMLLDAWTSNVLRSFTVAAEVSRG